MSARASKAEHQQLVGALVMRHPLREFVIRWLVCEWLRACPEVEPKLAAVLLPPRTDGEDVLV